MPTLLEVPRIDTLPVETLLVETLCADPLAAPLWHAGFRAHIGVSACLMGEKVRYDGDHRRSNMIATMLPLAARMVPLCPEVAIGMGVPRPTIQRVRLADGREVVRGTTEHLLDVTARLDDYAAQVSATTLLHGYIFKARSPSCGPGNAPLFDEQGVQIGVASGRYAEQVRRMLADAPMCDEEALTTLSEVADFVTACYRYAATRHLV